MRLVPSNENIIISQLPRSSKSFIVFLHFDYSTVSVTTNFISRYPSKNTSLYSNKKSSWKGGSSGGEKRRSPTRAVKRSNLHSSVSHRLCQLILVSNHSRKVWSRSRRGKCRDIVQGTFQFRLRCFRRLHSWTDCRWTGHATKIIKFIDSIKFYKMVAWLTSKVHDFFCVHDIRSSIALVLLSGESS